jgi:hypothetical protein
VQTGQNQGIKNPLFEKFNGELETIELIYHSHSSISRKQRLIHGKWDTNYILVALPGGSSSTDSSFWSTYVKLICYVVEPLEVLKQIIYLHLNFPSKCTSLLVSSRRLNRLNTTTVLNIRHFSQCPILDTLLLQRAISNQIGMISALVAILAMYT